MRYVTTLLTTLFILAITATGLFAGEAAAEAVESTTADEGSLWLKVLGTVITAVFAILSGFLAKRFNADVEQRKIDATKSLMEQKNFIIDNRIIPFAISTIEHWQITQLPKIVADLSDGGDFKWKDHFENLKSYVKKRIIKKFAKENIDILEELGEEELDNLIDRLIMKLITYLPPSVKQFLPKQIVDKLTDFGTAFAVEKGKELLGVDGQ